MTYEQLELLPICIWHILKYGNRIIKSKTTKKAVAYAGFKYTKLFSLRYNIRIWTTFFVAFVSLSSPIDNSHVSVRPHNGVKNTETHCPKRNVVAEGKNLRY